MANNARSKGDKPSPLRGRIVTTVVVVAIVALVAVVGNWFAGRADEASRAREFYHAAPQVAATCIYQTTSGEFGFSDHFMMCVVRNEYIAYRDTPSGACMLLQERSREQLRCIMNAEYEFELARHYSDRSEREQKWRAEQEAKAKAEQAARDAADKVATPKVSAAIDKLAPKDDQQRRAAALVVSCKYAEDEAGFRVAYRVYARASQKGVDAYGRFSKGRFAVCNENQVMGR